MHDFDDCTLLFHPLFAETVGLTAVGEAIWRALERGRNLGEVAAEVRAQFDGAPDDIEEDIREFVADLKRRGFVREEVERAAQTSPTPNPLPLPTTGEAGGRGEDFPAFSLALGDGSRFKLRGGDEKAAEVVAFFARAAKLPPADLHTKGERGLLVVSDGHNPGGEAGATCTLLPLEATRFRGRQLDEHGQIKLITEPLDPSNWFWQQLARLSAFIAAEIQACGGVLLHSGLAVYKPHLIPPASFPSPFRGGEGGAGVLLAGRSGVGKSTASRRLPPPWRALCDDVTLVERDPEGGYRAHPWPTWSRFFGEEAGDGSDTWEVQQSVPLKAIFILEQCEHDRVETMGTGQAVALLAELARQTSTYLLRGWPTDQIAAYHRRRFENLCALVEAVPAYLLDVSLEGRFWEEAQRALDEAKSRRK